MLVAGFTIIRNALKYDYPVVEAITSILPLCDIFYVGVGNSDDETKKLIESIHSKKIKIIDTVWDDSMREGGKVLSLETNKVFDVIPNEYDWCFYIQSDECVHEEDLPKIKSAMLTYKDDSEVNGLLFEYKHFYGHYKYIGIGRRWYKNEIRIIKNNKNIRSYKDAQGFRTIDDKKLRVKKTGAFIYHYGWVKSPQAQQAKQSSFHKMWHSDEWMKNNIPEVEEFDYNNIDLLEIYKGSHPKVFEKRITEANWNFRYDPKKIKTNLKYRFLFWVEKLTGWRVGENRNYKVQ
ncbi:glycosyltransferase family 2 protein [Aurantibacillus circumpalustris]|uniref:glycosyltransferase family 2 protein n=1 Tax=Aurantibacillus circumpalustris TaxID=3036359 RepID=UPI00295BAE84|nr:glycosyltransferase family 2 protein [Aurantibacillus circumpalustris]